MNNFSNSTTIYVSDLIGDDTLSGYTPKITGFGDGPVKTIERAIEMVKSMRVCNINFPVTIMLMSDIFLTNTINLDSQCKNIIFNSYKGKFNIFGGIKINNFKKDVFNGIKCLSFTLPKINDSVIKFTDLYVNLKRANIAKYPKEKLFKAQKTQFNSETECFLPSKWFIACKNDLNEIDDIDQAILSFTHFFIDEHSPIESFDKIENKVTLKYMPCMTMNTNYDAPNSSTFFYYLENVKKGFTEVNDWYVDYKDNKLYYIPENFDNIESIEAYIPVINKFFEIIGEEENKISGIRFSNIGFSYTKGDYIGKNMNIDEGLFASDEQSWAYAYGSISFKNAFNCEFNNCSFNCLGLHAIEILNNCSFIRITNCDIHNVGGSGIKIFADKNSEKITSNILISNNIIHDCSERYFASCGIISCHSSCNEIVDNVIYNIKYTGISLGWIWGYTESKSHSNIIRRNHVHHIGNGPLSDMGAIYLLGKQDGTIVESNIVHDVNSIYGGTYGIYADEGTSYAIFQNNVVFNTTLACFHAHLCNQNVVKNNIFCYGGKNIINVSFNENHIMSIFNNNILISDESKIYGNSYKHFIYPNPSFYSNFNTIISNKKIVMTKIGIEQKEISFDEWKKIYGLDIDSKQKINKKTFHQFLDIISKKIDGIGVIKSIDLIYKEVNK